MGTGTTGVAAKSLGRNWIGFDLQEEYIKIAKKE
jgi:DNA modification methylase